MFDPWRIGGSPSDTIQWKPSTSGISQAAPLSPTTPNTNTSGTSGGTGNPYIDNLFAPWGQTGGKVYGTSPTSGTTTPTTVTSDNSSPSPYQQNLFAPWGQTGGTVYGTSPVTTQPNSGTYNTINGSGDPYNLSALTKQGGLFNLGGKASAERVTNPILKLRAVGEPMDARSKVQNAMMGRFAYYNPSMGGFQ